MTCNPFLELMLSVLILVLFFATDRKHRRISERSISVSWGNEYLEIRGRNHKDTVKLGTYILGLGDGLQSKRPVP